MPAIKQTFSGGCCYETIQKVKVIDNTLMEGVMGIGQVGWEVANPTSDENFIFIVWDRGDANFPRPVDGLYSKTRFQKIDECEQKQIPLVNCSCHYPQVKNVMCGIGPSAEKIKVCGCCKKEVV